MSITKLHTLSGIVFDCDAQAGDPVVVTGVKSSRLSPSINYQREITNGNAWAHFGAIYGASPVGSFSTLDVARCGAAIGLQGLNLLSTDTATGCTFSGRRKAAGGVRVAQGTALHIALTALDGMAVIRSISAGHQTDASMEVETMATSADGSTAPLIESATHADCVPPDDTHRYTLGPVTLANAQGSITLSQNTQIEIDFRPTLEVFGSDSDIYPSIANITVMEPILRITTLDVTQFVTNIPISGRLVTGGSGSTIVLRKRSKSNASGFVGADAAEHIIFTLLDGLAYHGSVFEASSPAGNAQAVIEIPLIGTTSSFPLSVAWAAAYD